MLTHIQITSAKPSAKPFNLSDSQGLYLTVQPNGSKLWRLLPAQLDSLHASLMLAQHAYDLILRKSLGNR